MERCFDHDHKQPVWWWMLFYQLLYPVYTIQPVEQLVVQPVGGLTTAVEQPAASCENKHSTGCQTG